VEFSVLGPLQVSVAGRLIPVRRGLPRALTVLLLLRRGLATPGEVIVDRLCGSEPPADSANAVHRVVSYLRRTLGPDGNDVLLTRAPGYALVVSDDAVDASASNEQCTRRFRRVRTDRWPKTRSRNSTPRCHCGGASR
jgi:DNA-binding SARP family transcriptional activator